MKPIFFSRCLLPAVVGGMALAASAVFADPQTAKFTGKSAEVQWTLADLNADLPADWSGYKFLTLELKSSTAQRFDVRIITAQGPRMVRIQPFQDAWIRAALPLAYFEMRDTEGFDLASLGNKSRAAYWINLHGQVGPLTEVQAIGLQMDNPIGSPTIEIRSAKLDKQSPGDAILEPKPLVDEFGQWIPKQWPGKAHSLEELKAAWAAEDESLKKPSEFGYSRYGGYASTQAKTTGFFRVEKIDSRWWFIDPEGHWFFSTGCDVMVPWSGTRTADRDGVFAALPPAGLKPPSYRGREGDTVSFYTWNLQRRFGDDWQRKWVDFSLDRLDHWGLNTVANWSSPDFAKAQRKPYIIMLRNLGIQGGYLGLPDVYADTFPAQIEAAVAEQCAPHKDDPWLLGYFLANEPPWPGREAEIVSAILTGTATPIQRKAKEFLAAGDNTQRRKDFVNGAIEQFIDTINAALRKADPNHLNLGVRFGSKPSEAMLHASRNFDVFSMNNYGTAVNAANVDAAYKITERPVLIGEFHFGTPGRGLAAGLVQCKNEEERGVAYRYYVEQAAANPAIIGTHWFQWADEPNTGRFDGENYNIGLVDVTDRPYQELIDAMQATHARLLDIHSGKEKPVDRKALAQ